MAEGQGRDRAARQRKDERHRDRLEAGELMNQLVQNLVLGLLLGGVYALAAGGLTLIFGVMRVINIAHGAFLMLGAFITYSLWDRLGIDPLLAIFMSTPVIFAMGWVTCKVAVALIRGAAMAVSVQVPFPVALIVVAVKGQIGGIIAAA